MITLSTRNERNATVAMIAATKFNIERVFGIRLSNGVDMTLLNDFLKESGIYGGNYEVLTESEAL
jgi:hypothetical protein